MRPFSFMAYTSECLRALSVPSVCFESRMENINELRWGHSGTICSHRAGLRERLHGGAFRSLTVAARCEQTKNAGASGAPLAHGRLGASRQGRTAANADSGLLSNALSNLPSLWLHVCHLSWIPL